MIDLHEPPIWDGGNPIFPPTFMHHFDVCNTYWFRRKRLFYALKNWFLERYGLRDGNDLSHWHTWYCGECWGRVSDAEMIKCGGKHCGGDWSSYHAHILTRHRLRFSLALDQPSLFESVVGWRVYHCPADGYFYEDWKGNAKESAGFREAKAQCKNQFPMKPKQVDPSKQAGASLRWLIAWCRMHLGITQKLPKCRLRIAPCQ